MMKSGLVWAWIVGILLFAGAPVHAEPAPGKPDKAYAEYLNLIQNFAGWAEDHWNEKTQSYDAAGAGVSWARGNGDVCICYAVLLTELPDQPTISPKKIKREVMLDHIQRTLQSLCLNNKNCTDPAKAKKPTWGGPSWQSALETEHWVVAAYLLRDQLDARTKALVRQVATAEADTSLKPIPNGEKGDTAADDCCWNCGLLGVVAAFYDDDARAAKWDEGARRWGLNTEARESDHQNDTVVDGKPLKEWVVSTQVYPDLTLENHNFWDLPYQVCYSAQVEPAMAYVLRGKKIPDAFYFHALEEAEILKWTTLVDGDLLCPQGLDWAERDVQHSWAFTELGTMFDQPWARSAERRCLDLLNKRQSHFGDGALHANDFGYETDLINCWCYSLLMHKYFGRADAEPAFAEPTGTKVFQYVDVGVYRTPDMVSSVTWFRSRQPIMIVPNNAAAMGEYPSFTAYRGNTRQQKQISGTGYIDLVGDRRLRAFNVDGKPSISQENDALTVSFDRTIPKVATQTIGYCALPTGEVVVFSKWKALGDIKINELVDHPFYWMQIKGFLPERKVTQVETGTWSIDGKLRMQIVGGAPGKQIPGGIIGSAKLEPFTAKSGETLMDSVCIYQAEVPGKSPVTATGDSNSLKLNGWTIQRAPDGKLTLTKG